MEGLTLRKELYGCKTDFTPCIIIGSKIIFVKIRNWHITLSPFEYDKKTKSLYLTEDVEVDVIYTKKDTTESPYKVKWMRRE